MIKKSDPGRNLILANFHSIFLVVSLNDYYRIFRFISWISIGKFSIIEDRGGKTEGAIRSLDEKK